MDKEDCYREKKSIYSDFIDHFLFCDSLDCMKEMIIKVLNNFPDFNILCEHFHISPPLIEQVLVYDWNITCEDLMALIIALRKACQLKLIHSSF